MTNDSWVGKGYGYLINFPKVLFQEENKTKLKIVFWPPIEKPLVKYIYVKFHNIAMGL